MTYQTTALLKHLSILENRSLLSFLWMVCDKITAFAPPQVVHKRNIGKGSFAIVPGTLPILLTRSSQIVLRQHVVGSVCFFTYVVWSNCRRGCSLFFFLLLSTHVPA